jgi:hypothetical protein
MAKSIPGTFTAPTVINSSEGEFVTYQDFDEIIQGHNHLWSRTGGSLFSFVWDPIFETTATGTLVNQSASAQAQGASGLYDLFKAVRPIDGDVFSFDVFAMLYNMEVVIDLYEWADLTTVYDTITLSHGASSWSLESQTYQEDFSSINGFVVTIREFNSGTGTGYCAFVDGRSSIIASPSDLPTGR